MTYNKRLIHSKFMIRLCQIFLILINLSFIAYFMFIAATTEPVPAVDYASKVVDSSQTSNQ